jgi:hypothetical protein
MTSSGIMKPICTLVLSIQAVSETSNLLKDGRNPLGDLLFARFKFIIDRSREDVISSRQAAAVEEFKRVGAADASLIELASKGVLVMTTEFDVYDACSRRRLPVINCRGSGKVGQSRCPDCGGTGKAIEGIGGA